MTTLVFSYSHADEALRNELEKHLSPLKRMGKISTWHDRRIVPGQEFENQIDHYFSQADIILLLISSDFIASDYCYQVEMTNALERHKWGEAVVIPVILRECAWHQLPFGSIMAATVDGKPITKFASHDEGYVQVVNAVSRAIANMEAKKPQQSAYVSSTASGWLFSANCPLLVRGKAEAKSGQFLFRMYMLHAGALQSLPPSNHQWV